MDLSSKRSPAVKQAHIEHFLAHTTSIGKQTESYAQAVVKINLKPGECDAWLQERQCATKWNCTKARKKVQHMKRKREKAERDALESIDGAQRFSHTWTTDQRFMQMTREPTLMFKASAALKTV